MDENGTGLNEVCSDSGIWWCHVCECGHSWDSMQQVDTCWLCDETNISTMDKQTADARTREIEIQEVPETLLEDII